MALREYRYNHKGGTRYGRENKQREVTGFGGTPTDGSMKLPIVITKAEECGLMERYGSYVDQKIEELIEDNLEEHEFYGKLVKFIVSDSMLQDGTAGAIVIFDYVIDKRFP